MTAQLKEKFVEYHNDNPHIYEAFESYALIAANHRGHFGALTIIHRIRWDTMIAAKGDQFKVNNNYAAYFARMFEENHPKHKGFFRMRGV